MLDDSLPYLTTNMVRLAVAQTRVDALTTSKTEFDAAFELYAATHTPQNNARMRAAYADSHGLMTEIQQQLKRGEVVLTDADIFTLQVPVNATPRKSIPAPIVAPDNLVRSTMKRFITFSATDPTPGRKTPAACRRM